MIPFGQESVKKFGRLAEHDKALAERTGCTFLDAALVTRAGKDELHMDAESHRAMAEAVAAAVKDIL